MRDGACLATASCALAFPEECKAHLPVLFPLWIRQLDDNVWSVRAHAAMGLADVIRAYQQEALDVVLPHLRYHSTPTLSLVLVTVECMCCVQHQGKGMRELSSLSNVKSNGSVM